MKLPGEDFKIEGLTRENNGLLLVGSTRTLLYDLRQDTLSDAPLTLVERVQLHRAARERVVRELGGNSPDWYDEPSSEPSR